MSKNRGRKQNGKQTFSKPMMSASAAGEDQKAATAAANETVKAPIFYRERPNGGASAGLAARLKQHWWAVVLIALFSIGAVAGGLKYLEDEAKREIAGNYGKSSVKKERGVLSAINPFMPPPLPTPTPQLSKEYIYAGSRQLAVEDVNANASPPADLAVWRPSTGYWYVMGPNSSIQAYLQWGVSTDIPVPGDYDGDGKTDFAVFRPSNSTWYVVNSSDGSTHGLAFGTTNDKPVPADYDGDGKTDAAVYRETASNTGTWYVSKSSDGNLLAGQFGLWSDEPLPRDFDGDGKADFSVHRDGSAAFYITKSSNGATQTIQLGASGDKPVPADYDGDGKVDAAVWRGSNNNWYITKTSDNQTINFQFGNQNNDIPVPADYDADGKVDVAVWRFYSTTTSEIGDWYILQSSNSVTRQDHWGTSGDKPFPAFWRR